MILPSFTWKKTEIGETNPFGPLLHVPRGVSQVSLLPDLHVLYVIAMLKSPDL